MGFLVNIKAFDRPAKEICPIDKVQKAISRRHGKDLDLIFGALNDILQVNDIDKGIRDNTILV